MLQGAVGQGLRGVSCLQPKSTHCRIAAIQSGAERRTPKRTQSVRGEYGVRLSAPLWIARPESVNNPGQVLRSGLFASESVFFYVLRLHD
jgi:hypothetical protein